MPRTKECPLDQGATNTLPKPAEKRVFLWQNFIAENPIPLSIASLITTIALSYLWIAGPNNPFKGRWWIYYGKHNISISHKIASCSSHATLEENIGINNVYTVRQLPDTQQLLSNSPHQLLQPTTYTTSCYP